MLSSSNTPYQQFGGVAVFITASCQARVTSEERTLLCLRHQHPNFTSAVSHCRSLSNFSREQDSSLTTHPTVQKKNKCHHHPPTLAPAAAVSGAHATAVAPRTKNRTNATNTSPASSPRNPSTSTTRPPANPTTWSIREHNPRKTTTL
jgi:hypothetical protein